MVDADFRLSTSFDGREKPTKEFHQCHTILSHSTAIACNLCFVLDGLHRGDEAGMFQYFCVFGYAGRQFHVRAGRVEEYVFVEIVAEPSAGEKIRFNSDALLLQISLDFVRYLVRRNIQDGLVEGDQHITDKQRTTMYVGAA